MTRQDAIELLFGKGYDYGKLCNMKDKKLLQLYNQVFNDSVLKFEKY